MSFVKKNNSSNTVRPQLAMARDFAHQVMEARRDQVDSLGTTVTLRVECVDMTWPFEGCENPQRGHIVYRRSPSSRIIIAGIPCPT